MKKIILFILGISLFLPTSCDFGRTNIDPANLSDASLAQIVTAATAQAAYNNSALLPRLAGIIMQHFSGNDAQQLAYTAYNIDESATFNGWNLGLYAGVMKDAAVMIEKGEKESNPYYVGIAKILMANALGTTTSIWGDIPYSQALKPEQFPQPEFDTQEQIYTSIQTLLDEAITALSAPAYTNPAPPGNSDLYCQGSTARWIATARALKARYYLHLSRRGLANVTSALNAINAGALASNAVEPMFPFQAALTNANPYFLFNNDRPNTMRIAPSFITTLTARNDPRASRIFAGTSFYGATTTFWTQATSALPLISFAEVRFIQAEALLLTGNAAAAETAMSAGITANMQRMGVLAADVTTYITARGNFTGLTTDAQRLQRIVEEKYVALYAQAPIEVWTDYRRTGYPVLTPTPGGDAAGLNPGGQIPRRLIYPITERTTNGANLDAAKTRQGGDLMNVNLWAFKP